MASMSDASNVAKRSRSSSSMVPRNTAFGSGLDASERMRTSSRSSSSRSMVPMNTAPPDDLDGDGGEAARRLGFDGALFVSSAVPDAAALGLAPEMAPPSAVFFLGARLRRRLFFSVLAAPPPGGAVAPSPSEAAARFRANGTRRVICRPPGVRARRGATGATTRADIPVAPLVLPGLTPRVTRACEAAACAIMTDGVAWCRDAVPCSRAAAVAFLPPRSYPALHRVWLTAAQRFSSPCACQVGQNICC